jgi:hypothetical protein
MFLCSHEKGSRGWGKFGACYQSILVCCSNFYLINILYFLHDRALALALQTRSNARTIAALAIMPVTSLLVKVPSWMILRKKIRIAKSANVVDTRSSTLKIKELTLYNEYTNCIATTFQTTTLCFLFVYWSF